MLFPISDDDREINKPVFVTYILLALNIIVYMLQVSNPELTYGWSMIPREIVSGEDLVEPIILNGGNGEAISIPQTNGPPIIYLTLITSLFMHGSFMHLAGNMLYLWIFGDNVEHRFGHLPFLIFYLAAGVAGSFAQIAMDPGSVIPNLGASGAIAGILGAYIVLFPRNKVNAVIFYAILSVPAVVVLGLWIAMQFVLGFGFFMSVEANTGGVAYMAHIGGFVTGVVAGGVWRTTHPSEPDSVLKRQYDRDPRVYRIW